MQTGQDLSGQQGLQMHQDLQELWILHAAKQRVTPRAWRAATSAHSPLHDTADCQDMDWLSMAVSIAAPVLAYIYMYTWSSSRLSLYDRLILVALSCLLCHACRPKCCCISASSAARCRSPVHNSSQLWIGHSAKSGRSSTGESVPLLCSACYDDCFF